MAQPSPIFVTPSTTLVQVPTIQNPYTPVLLNAYSYTGQVVSILDGTSSFGVTQNPIVVSTGTAGVFTDGSISTLINQPQGFLTLQAASPTTWAFLNQFPFWNQYTSAGLYNLTTSTLLATHVSTLQEYTSSLIVENLRVSGNFSISSGVTLNQSISTLSSVNVYSSFTTWGDAFFYGGTSTLGGATFLSSVHLVGNVTTPSSITFLSSLYVSTSVSAISSLSTSLLNLSGSLNTYSLVVQQSSLTDVNVAGSLQVSGLFKALSDIYLGSDVTSWKTQTGHFSTLSSLQTTSLNVNNLATFQQNLSTQESLVILGSLSTLGITYVEEQILAKTNLRTGGMNQIDGYVSTLDFQADHLSIEGNFGVNPSLTNITPAQKITINQSFGVGSFTANSTTIGGTLSTTAFTLLEGNVFLDQRMDFKQEVSTLTSFSTLGDMYVLGSLSSLNTFYVSGSVVVGNELDVLGTSYWNQSTISSSYIHGDLSILGNLTLTDTLILSSITLPSSLLANNFQVSSLYVGYGALVSSCLISSLYASSLTTGGLTYPLTPMDMANPLITYYLSTNQISTLEFNASSEGSIQPNTFFQVTSTFGVDIMASTNTFDVNTIAYTLSNTYVSKFISANTIFADNISGLLFGDATLLQNVRYPQRLSTGVVTNSTILTDKITMDYALLSSLTAVNVVTNSTMTIGPFSLFGNAQYDTSLSTIYLAGFTGYDDLVKLNPIYSYGDSAGANPRQVIINSDSNFLTNFPTGFTGTLGVGGSLRMNAFSSPNFVLPLDTYFGDIVVTKLLGTYTSENIYVSSGVMGLSSGALFLNEQTSLVARSTNTIQPYYSTLQFNSTLFVTQDSGQVGIGTFPNYTLDVKGTAFIASSVMTNASSIIQNQIWRQPAQPPLWIGVGSYSAGTSSNIRYSYDGETWFGFTGASTSPNLPLAGIANDGGRLGFSPPVVTGSNLWIAPGGLGGGATGGNILYSKDPLNTWEDGTIQPVVGKLNRLNFNSATFNGQYWVATSLLSVTTPALDHPIATLMWSSNGINWSNSISGGFQWNSSGTLTNVIGARSVVWNGSLWVAVGAGSNTSNTILYSGDGSNWSNSTDGGFSDGPNPGGYGVVWTGRNWVATGFCTATTSFVYSSDGSNWTACENGVFGGDYEGRAIAWNGYRLVATGPEYIFYSDDHGSNWNLCQGTLFPGSTGFSVQWNGSYWLAAGSNGVRKSYDGITWFNPPTAPSYPFEAIAYTSNAMPSLLIGTSSFATFSTINVTAMNIAMGEDNTGCNTRTIYNSTDGSNWFQTGSGRFDVNGKAVAYDGNSTWIAVGSNSDTSNVLYSDDGETWFKAVNATAFPFGQGNGLVFGIFSGTSYCATAHDINGENLTMFYSASPTLGKVFYKSDGDQFSVSGKAIATDGAGKFFAVGDDGGTGVTARWGASPTSWSSNGFTNMFDMRGNTITYGAGKFVAGGFDTGGLVLKYSAAGFTWTDCTFAGAAFTEVYGVAYNGSNLWVAVGYTSGSGGTIKYSTDGITWNDSVSGEFLDKGYGIAYNEFLGLWIAGGTQVAPGDGLRYSTDGMNWFIGSGTQFVPASYGIGTSGSRKITLNGYYSQVRLMDNPTPAVLERDITPYIAYKSSLLDLNNVIKMDSNANVIIGSSTLQTYVSTLYETGTTIVTGFVSTPSVKWGGFFLGIQSV